MLGSLKFRTDSYDTAIGRSGIATKVSISGQTCMFRNNPCKLGANIIPLAAPVSAAQPGNRELQCNSKNPMQNTQYMLAKNGPFLQNDANKYCAQENGSRWTATDLINRKRECKQKAWW
jgi:hypothetical protein